MDVLRRQLAESRASLDSEHRSSERQGDGDVARHGARRRRPSSRTASSCRRASFASDGVERRESVWREGAAHSGVSHGDRRRAARAIRLRRHGVRARRGPALRAAVRVHGAGAARRDAGPVRARRRDGATVLAARRTVSVREARALQSSTRFGGMENASAIFYSDGPFRRGGTARGNDRARDSASVVRRRGHRARVAACVVVGGVRDVFRRALDARRAWRQRVSRRRWRTFVRRFSPTAPPFRTGR